MESAKTILDAAIKRYMAAINTLDEGQFLACFRDNGLLRDPYGSFRYVGHDGLHQYFQTLVNTWQSMAMTVGQKFYGDEERVAFTWTVRATAKNGKTATYDGIAVLTVEGELIDGLESYWDAVAMFDQIKD